MYTYTRLAGANVLSVRSTMHEAVKPVEMPVLAPSSRLKVLPRANGRPWGRGDAADRRLGRPERAE
jgi:hypothetical protein